jgi:RimJ/RimL family protein N-acetyltransferase
MTMPPETVRLRLRCARSDDAQWLVGLMNEPAFIENIGDRGVRTAADARDYIAAQFEHSYERNGHGLYVVELKAEGARIGLCGLVRRDTLPYPDIGFAFLERFRGQGLAREAAQAVLAQAAELELPTVLAIVREGNRPSIRLLERLGFARQGDIRLAGIDTARLLYSAEPQG